MTYPRFFWIGETSEVFVAESFEQLVADEGQCGSGLERFDKGVPVDEFGDPIEWGEINGNCRLTIRDCDENGRPRGTLAGSMHDMYAWLDGGRYNMPVMFFTQYA